GGVRGTHVVAGEVGDGRADGHRVGAEGGLGGKRNVELRVVGAGDGGHCVGQAGDGVAVEREGADVGPVERCRVDRLAEGHTELVESAGGGAGERRSGDRRGGGVVLPGRQCFVQVQSPTGDGLARQRSDWVGVVHHLVDDLPVGPGRVQVLDQGHRAGDERGGHRGAAEGGVAAVFVGAVDARAGGAEFHRVRPVIGERREPVGAGRGGDGDNVVEVVVGGIVGGDVVVGAGVAGGGHEDVTLGAGVVEGVEHRLVIPAAAPAVVGDLRPVIHRVVERQHGVAERPAAVGVQELHRHYLHVPVDAGHADAVVPLGADDPGDVRAVAVVVVGIVVVGNEVPAVDVVDEPVVVVVDSVAGDFAGLRP